MTFLGQVLIFSVKGCPFCARCKKLFVDLQIPFVEVDLEKYPERRSEVQSLSGRRSVPQIFFNERHIGGYSELQKLYSEGKLEELLREVAENEALSGAPTPPPISDEDSVIWDFFDAQTCEGTECEGCTPDDLATLVTEIQDSGLIGLHMYHLVPYRNTLVGRELVDWLVKVKHCSREEAVSIGSQLHDRHFLHHVTFEHNFKDDYYFYRLLGDIRAPALNAHLSHTCVPRPGSEVANDLRRCVLEIYNGHLAADGSGVDYEGIRTSNKFEAYVRSTAELKRLDLHTFTREESLAFFINIYNAMVIHAFIAEGPPTSVWRRYRFFNSTSYVIGGLVFSLNDIENGVLRANRRAVGAWGRPFGRTDPRLKVALVEHEPRIHFALVCGAKSCPPIRTYTATNIDEELTLTMEAFLEGGGCIVDMSRREVALSMILKWYSVDFGSNPHEVLQWICAHLPNSQKKTDLGKLLVDNNYRIRYLPYNWDLNSLH